MNSIYERLLWLYPAKYRRQFAEEMCGVFQNVSAEMSGQTIFARTEFFCREYSGLLSAAAREHLRSFTLFNRGSLLSTRRFNMRNGFRFPKSTAVLMTLILFGVIMAIRKGEAIATSLPHVNPQLGPILPGHSTLLPPIAEFFAFFYALGLVGWAILFAMRRSGVHRLDHITGTK